MGSPLEQHFVRRLVGIFGTICIVYLVLLAFLVFIQRNLMYFPDDVRFTPESAQLDGFTELNYQTPDGHPQCWQVSGSEGGQDTVVRGIPWHGYRGGNGCRNG